MTQTKTIRKSLLLKALLVVSALVISSAGHSQLYEGLVNYAINGTPTNGVKIKTNLPFTNGSQMPTIRLFGYNYASGEMIDLVLVYYIYGGAFINYGVTSSGGFQPAIKLANENNKVVLFIDSRQYFQRFTVSAYARGMSAEGTVENFQGWRAVDEPLTGTQVVTIPYKNKITGNLALPGGTWTSTGKLGIGTTTPKEVLSVNGTVQAKEVKVTTEAADWPDYVFDSDYLLLPLDSLARQIRLLGHLPDMPSADQIGESGLELGALLKAQQKKIEELTLYIIGQNKRIKALEQKINSGK